MSKRKKHTAPDAEKPSEIVQPFVRGTRVADEKEIWLNDRYQVAIYDVLPISGWPAMLHLCFKRRDKRAIHDWRVIQQIKNLIAGPENEAVELYPAESRLVDGANQYHLWVLANSAERFPFGFPERVVSEKTLPGGRQRPWPIGHKPKGADDDEILKKAAAYMKTIKEPTNDIL